MSEDNGEKKIGVYFRSGKGIEDPVDATGRVIKVGDKLTWDFHDPYYQETGVDDWMKEPIYVVKEHENGYCLCGIGIEKELYLHDFRFKYCEVVD